LVKCQLDELHRLVLHAREAVVGCKTPNALGDSSKLGRKLCSGIRRGRRLLQKIAKRFSGASSNQRQDGAGWTGAASLDEMNECPRDVIPGEFG
jgi:hypothetical protein